MEWLNVPSLGNFGICIAKKTIQVLESYLEFVSLGTFVSISVDYIRRLYILISLETSLSIFWKSDCWVEELSGPPVN